jgi:alpha-L-fucosidase
VNGEAIYGTHNWIKFREDGERGEPGLNIRFTVKDKALYAIILGNWPGAEAVITSLATTHSPPGKIKAVSMLGSKGRLQFTQDDTGLKVKLPAAAP